MEEQEDGRQDAGGRRQAARDNEPMLYCPVCSTRLTDLKCKLVCNKCGYYMSCADYY
jgi:methionyl-tRNA synthetase